MGFVGDIFLPITVSTQMEVYSDNELMINIGLILMWGVQHSVMARGQFKDMIASYCISSRRAQYACIGWCHHIGYFHVLLAVDGRYHLASRKRNGC
ncbi:MAG: hypothetical protein A6F72_00655 [Cycloclasticus sp. symbiont of Poecilosclerida sp. N]|nr:MAG: hypothetical protein A6F72_00655 [Cycloclasticus sp. symbiont of Poecilosclerida sp. N]